MRESRFVEEQIIKILKERSAGLRLMICAGGTASAAPCFTSGGRNCLMARQSIKLNVNKKLYRLQRKND